MFEAGSDTTTSLTISLFLACANDPSIAKTAQAEIDRVVGDDRMPTFADLEDIPCALSFLHAALFSFTDVASRHHGGCEGASALEACCSFCCSPRTH